MKCGYTCPKGNQMSQQKPKQSSVSLVEGEGLTSASAWQYQIVEQSLMWRSTLRRSQSWYRICKNTGWLMRLFGQMPEPSTAKRGEERWIGSLAAIRASGSQSQESNRDTPTPETSGQTSGESLMKLDPEDASLKTWGNIFKMDTSTLLSPTLKGLATASRKRSSARQTLVRPIAGSASLSWATPVGHDHKSEKSTLGRSLGREALNWASPVAADSAQGDIENENTKYVTTGTGRLRKISNNGESGSLGLAREVKHWATPVADEVKSGTRNHQGRSLNKEVHTWATPTASDDEHKVTVNSHQPGLVGEVDRFSGRPVQEALKIGGKLSKSDQTSLPRLNPKFVEWLMGWPENWLVLTNSASSGTE